MPAAARSVPEIANDLGDGDSGNSERMGEAEWFVPLASPVFRLGQRSDAPLGSVANVSESRVLLTRDIET